MKLESPLIAVSTLLELSPVYATIFHPKPIGKVILIPGYSHEPLSIVATELKLQASVSIQPKHEVYSHSLLSESVAEEL